MESNAKAEFWRQWAISGMPKDKQRLAEAAYIAGLREAAARAEMNMRVQIPEESTSAEVAAHNACCQQIADKLRRQVDELEKQKLLTTTTDMKP